MPRLGTFSATSYRAWAGATIDTKCANSGYVFPILIPNASDNYTLSQLGTPQIGAHAWSINTGFIKYLINGQGRGIFGTGQSGSPTPTRYMLLYDPSGAGNYSYGAHDDCFQPGVPHEMGMIYVDGKLALGGGNEGPAGIANSTIRSWQMPGGRIVVLMGGVSFGHAVFQYFSYPGESIVRMQMSYTNTTNTSHRIKIQRGGDPDWGQFPSINGRGITPVPPTNVVYATDPSQNRTVSVYTPGNGYYTNSAVIADWPLYSPDQVLDGTNSGSSGDFSIYNAWDLGTVNPGQTVFVTCFYIVGNILSFPNYIC